MPLKTDTLLDAALEYASKGFAVLPLHFPIIKNGIAYCSCQQGSDCESIGKHPSTDHGVYDATCDVDQIKSWWLETPKANIGIATGIDSGFISVDCDSLCVIDRADTLGLPLSPRVETGNGQHIWLAHPGFNVPNKIKIDGFDFRGDGGLVVAPPSLHANGKRYRWLVSLETPLSACPEWLLELFKQQPQTQIETSEARTAISDQPYGLGALKKATNEIRSTTNGHRNNIFFKAVSQMAQLVAGGELTEATASFEMRDAGESIGLTSSEINKTFNSAWRSGVARPKSAPKKEQAPINLLDYRFENSDLGNAARMLAMHGSDIFYVGQWDTWVFWNGHYWQRDTIGHVPKLAYKMVRLMLNAANAIEDEDKRKAAIKFALTSENLKGLNAMLAITKEHVRVSADQFDTSIWLINVPNGTLNLKTGILQPFDKSDMLTKSISVTYDETAQCPKWLNFLYMIFAGDQNLIDYVQKAVGYSLTGDVSEDCLHFAHGGGGNGKSTFFSILEKILGEYADKAPSAMLMASKFEGIPVDIAELQGKRLVVASEISRNVRWNEAKLKDLTGGDRLKARYMRANPFSFQPTHKLWIYGNYKPTVIGADDGIWRRMRLIPFIVKIPDSIKDTNFEDKLIPELAGILNWAVQGCLKWQSEGLAPVEAIDHATHEYREEMDRLQVFINECCAVGESRKCVVNELWGVYNSYCRQSGEYCVDKTEFRERLKRKNFVIKNGTANKLYVFGVSYLNQAELIAQKEKTHAELIAMEIT